HIIDLAINSAKQSRNAFCKFISANDAGETGAHQAGFYMPKDTVPLMFETPGVKGENKDRFIKIKWQDDFETESRFIYYGKGSRNEYRLTRFGKGFPFLREQNVGDLLILAHIEEDQYEGFVLSHDLDIEAFFTEFNLTSDLTNRLISKDNSVNIQDRMTLEFMRFINQCQTDFPTSAEMSDTARTVYNQLNRLNPAKILKSTDQVLLEWIDTEYSLFKTFENIRYQDKLSAPFPNVEELIMFANSILNRRKSRAGKALENHLTEMFRYAQLQFEPQGHTELNKRPDFLFPGSTEYQNIMFDKNKLLCLGAKTTCKDRWRQILTEAEKIEVKHLFTLQQGISKNQLKEMEDSRVQLVVPESYIGSFDKSYQPKIMSLKTFIEYVQEVQR
ncbi:MAG: type II restriction endonuclease, partial [Bacteroidales bacterium]